MPGILLALRRVRDNWPRSPPSECLRKFDLPVIKSAKNKSKI